MAVNKAMTLAAATAALAYGCSPQGYGGPGGHSPGGWHMMYNGYGGWTMWIGVLVLIAVVIVLMLNSGRFKGGRGVGETALETLKRRYASGEITREEFEQMKADIEK